VYQLHETEFDALTLEVKVEWYSNHGESLSNWLDKNLAKDRFTIARTALIGGNVRYRFTFVSRDDLVWFKLAHTK